MVYNFWNDKLDVLLKYKFNYLLSEVHFCETHTTPNKCEPYQEEEPTSKEDDEFGELYILILVC